MKEGVRKGSVKSGGSEKGSVKGGGSEKRKCE